MKIALPVILLIGLCLIVSSVASILAPAPEIMPASPRAAIAQALSTERPTAIPTQSAAQATIEAGKARMVALAAESTDLALQITESVAEQSKIMTQTSAAHSWTVTAQADRATVQAQDATSQAAWERATATGRAVGTQAVMASTQVAATLVALEERVQSARAQGASEREFIPWVSAWSFGWPIALFGIVSATGIVLVARGWLIVERKAEFALTEGMRMELAEQAELEEDEADEDEPIEAPRIDIYNGAQVKRFQFPCTPQQLALLAAGVNAKPMIGLRDIDWIDNGFSAIEWPIMREYLIAHGLAQWRSQSTRERGARWLPLGIETLGKIGQDVEP